MVPLNLYRINITSPYTVWQEDDEWHFTSYYGIQFSIGFEEVEGTPVSAYWFNLINRSHKSSPNDKNVQKTIVCIIEEFFRTNPDILLYLCDSANDQQEVRSRLFLRWFDTYAQKDKFTIRTAVLSDEGVSDYVAMIVQNNNPNIEYILQFFDSEISLFTDNKPNNDSN